MISSPLLIAAFSVVVGALLGSFGTGWMMVSKLGTRVAVLESARVRESDDLKALRTDIAEIFRLLRNNSGGHS